MVKKLLAILLAVGLLGIFSVANAATISFGLESDFTINRDVIVSRSDALGVSDGKFNSSYEAQHYNYVVDIAVNDTFTVSPKIGFIKSNFNDEIDSDVGFNIGTDAKVKLYSGDVNIVLLGKYRFSKTEYDIIGINSYWFRYGRLVAVGVSTFRTDVKSHEYEIGPILSKSFGENTVVTPYFGFVYSDIKSDFAAGFSTFKVEAKDNIGLRLGTSVKLANNINLFIDGALIDKQGVTAKVTYTF